MRESGGFWHIGKERDRKFLMGDFFYSIILTKRVCLRKTLQLRAILAGTNGQTRKSKTSLLRQKRRMHVFAVFLQFTEIAEFEAGVNGKKEKTRLRIT